MSASVNNGPNVSTGNLEPDFLQDIEVGPDVLYQGASLIDPRYSNRVGRSGVGSPVHAIYTSVLAQILDIYPSAASALFTIGSGCTFTGSGSTWLTVATSPLSLTGMAGQSSAANAAQQAGLSLNVPIIPMGSYTPLAVGANAGTTQSAYPFAQGYLSGNVVTAPVALDLGNALVNLTSGSATATLTWGGAGTTAALSVFSAVLFQKGMWIIIPSGLSSTAALIAQVTAVNPGVIGTTASTLTLSVASGVTTNNLNIASVDSGGIAVWPFMRGNSTSGVALWDSTQLSARALSVTSNNVGDTNFTLIVRGYDVYGQPMTENIAVTANGTATGNKAWKYVSSVQLLRTTNVASSGTFVVNSINTFGFPIRNDFWEYLNVYWNGAYITSNTGWTAADAHAPTATTGDVRGTYAIQSNNPNGQRKMQVALDQPPYSAINYSNLNVASLYGLTQFTG